MQRFKQELSEPDALQTHILSTYTNLRWGLVSIAFTFPLVLYVGGHLFGEPPLPLQGSMSAYYHTVMRNGFVGYLFAIGACLYFYKGFTTLENYLLNAAGILAVGVAIFPTDYKGDQNPACKTFTWGNVHGVCAVTSFLCIALVCWFCASDTLSEMNDEAKAAQYRKAYNWIGIAMLVSPLVAAILELVYQFSRKGKTYTFFIELVAMWVFGTYWLVKSFEIRATNAEEKAATKGLNS